MEANFEQAMTLVLKHEGGYVDHPDDPGGATNYGISLRYLKDLKDVEGFLIGDLDKDGDVDDLDIRLMTKEKATEIYRSQWWDRYDYASLQDHFIAAKVFDFAINMGAGASHRLLQKALNELGFELDIDGKLGPMTRSAVEVANKSTLLWGLVNQAMERYVSLWKKNPAYASFLHGWLRRAFSGVPGL